VKVARRAHVPDGVSGPGGRKTYLAGAFPSACGKTSTAMLPGEKILGDDIAYFRRIKGKFHAVNAEAGIFGIIQNVNPKDDPVIWDVLNKPGEVIFSNILVNDGKPYWLGMGSASSPQVGSDTLKKALIFQGNGSKGNAMTAV
jgi:phosphoenolpyruvate carboxykinase (GTP)